MCTVVARVYTTNTSTTPRIIVSVHTLAGYDVKKQLVQPPPPLNNDRLMRVYHNNRLQILIHMVREARHNVR